ncbi:MAG: HAD hydrolase-like protein [Planctomycetia bacterium]|nr:HAD hydrolase-like protein [Planctomycetia bacterium]
MYDLKPQHPFFIGIDSDGCIFDTMEIKQKECFTPNTIKYWGLQGVSKYAREACEFVNLYSPSRGINRFPALVEELEWTASRPEVQARGVKIVVPQVLKDWIARESKLGNPTLIAEVERTHDPDLQKTLDWSLAINRAVEDMVYGVPPFPLVRESLQKMQGKADVLCVSQTPNEALIREWQEHDLAQYVTEICGQEFGTKKEVMMNASKFAPNHALMIGDAPGDFKAAQPNNALFYPINPGAEEASWERFYNEALDKFFNGTFAGAYQQMLLDEFNKYLPVNPPWLS